MDIKLIERYWKLSNVPFQIVECAHLWSKMSFKLSVWESAHIFICQEATKDICGCLNILNYK